MRWMDAHPDVRGRCSVRGVSHNTDLRQFQSIPLERDLISAGVRRLDYACALHAGLAQQIARMFGLAPDRIHVTGTAFPGKP